MKQTLKLLLLFLFLNTNAQKSQNIENFQLNSNRSKSVETSSISKLHLDIIFTALIEKNKFSKNTIGILNNYDALKNYNFSKNGYSFEVLEKSALQLDRVNRLLFWRMDISSDKAHYEFYLSTSDKDFEKYSYIFILDKGNWKLTQN